MAKQKPAAWADRRWKIFEHAVSTIPAFKNELLNINLTVDNGQLVIDDNVFQVIELMAKYNVPSSCGIAAALYACNSDLDRSSYLTEILPPFMIWEGHGKAVKVGRKHGASGAKSIQLRLQLAKDRGLLKADISNLDFAELASAFALNPMIEIMPGVNKTELKDFIDEYWDEIEGQLAASEVDDYSFTEALIGKVQPPKIKRVAERDALIMRLHDEGMNDTQIATHIIDETNFAKLSPEYIRVIRHRNKPPTD